MHSTGIHKNNNKKYLLMNYFSDASLFNNLCPDKKVRVPNPNRYDNVENIFKCIQKQMKRPKMAVKENIFLLDIKLVETHFIQSLNTMTQEHALE